MLLSSTIIHLVLGDLDLAGTPDLTGPPGCDETDLPTGRGSPLDGRWVTNMLMVTTTMGMLDGVHGHTAHLRPAVTLGLVLVVGTTGLQHGLVNTSTSGDDTDHRAVSGWDDFLGARWQLDSALLGVGVMRHHSGVVSGSLSDSATVTSFLLKRAHNGSLRHGAYWQDVSNEQSGLLSGIDELAGVHALGGHHGLGAELVAVWVAEADLGERRTSARVVDDVLDDALDVTMTLGVIYSAQTSRSLAVVSVGLEHRPGSLTLSSDDTTHCKLV